MTYTFESHKWGERKFMSWAICERCGLVLLNNRFTRWHVEKGCNARDHSGYARARIRYTAKENK